VVRGRLPSTWSVELQPGAERRLVIRAPDDRLVQFDVKSRKNLLPRDIPNLLLRQNPAELLIVAPFISPRSREMLIEAGASYADATGNLRIIAREPAIFLEARGLDRDPGTRPRSLKSLKGAAAGRVVRALCDFLPPYGVRTLAEISATPLGTVARVVAFLEEEALLARDERKRITSVDWAALIARWAQDYNVRTSNRLRSYIEPRGLSALTPKLANLERYALTGSLAAKTSIAPTRLAMLYVDDADEAARTLELTPAEEGANVWLLEPYDEVVFDRTRTRPFDTTERTIDVVVAAPSQVAADSMTGPGRGPQEAQALIGNMRKFRYAKETRCQQS
jgi:hypothetical protein